MKELRSIWDIELKILEEVDRICAKYNIQYFADYGTLLGAVRHKGFIPWDDDIDLAMFRKDYNRFRKIASKEFNNKFFCQSGYSDKGFYGELLHIRMNDTTAIKLNSFPNLLYHQGIFIDIFPLDGFIQNKFLNYLQSKLKKILNTILWRKNSRFCDISFWKRLILFFPTLFPQKLLFSIFESVCSWKNPEHSKYVISSFIGTKASEKRLRISYGNIQKLPFDRVLIPVPKNYDEVLTCIFGLDYMTPKLVANDHGEMFFDTKHSYKDYLSGKLQIPEEYINRCQNQ